MQVEMRRSNVERSETMRAALVRAARALFVTQGFAGTSTPDIANVAGVTRGALYHHFADKKALFDAVVFAEAQAVADAINADDTAEIDVMETLIRGSATFLATMQVPGRIRLLLIDAPAVLGRLRLDQIDAATGGQTLLQGLTAAQAAGAIKPSPVGPLAQLLSAGFDRAALAIDAGEPAADWHLALESLIRGLALR